jgi:rhodanese-related sulfurtransferase
MFNLFQSKKDIEMRDESRVYDLKSRLDWGEPALTIIDVRDRTAFNLSHISGAVSLPLEELVTAAVNSLEVDRDIYVYGDTDEISADAIERLKAAGYQRLSLVRGGVAAWKAADFPVESNSAIAAS